MKRYIKCSSSQDFEINDEGLLVKYNGPGGDVVIPEEVVSIDGGAFHSCKSLTSVTIPNSVIRIGDSAFFNCTSLTTVKIPDSVTYIGPYSFESCELLKSIKIPEGVKRIATCTFKNCTSLETVTIPDSVRTIGDFAFKNCTSLESMSIPSIYIYIGYSSFENCTSLKNVSLPDDFDIADSAFDGCSSLKSSEVSEYLDRRREFHESMEHNSESSNDTQLGDRCIITYFKNTAAAERRSATEDDLEDEIITTDFNALDELDCLETAFDEAGINSAYCETVEDYLDYLNNQDIGDGEPYMLEVIYNDKLIYESSMTKDDIIEEIKQDIE